jgi:hypothetical protein
MGGWGTALYPRDESMRYRGDPSGERLTHAEMAQKVRLERCFGGRSQPGPKSGGRMPIKGPSPVQERVAPDYRPVGSRRPPPSRAIAPPPPPPPPRGSAPSPIRMPFSPPLVPPQQSQGGRGRGGRGRGGESLALSNHRDRCSSTPWGCQVCCSHQDPQIRSRGWPS